MLAISHFEVYIDGNANKLTIYTDHNPLQFLDSMKSNNRRLLKWSLTISKNNVEIIHIPGVDNMTADCLSRPEHESPTETKLPRSKPHQNITVSPPQSQGYMPTYDGRQTITI